MALLLLALVPASARGAPLATTCEAAAPLVPVTRSGPLLLLAPFLLSMSSSSIRRRFSSGGQCSAHHASSDAGRHAIQTVEPQTAQQMTSSSITRPSRLPAG